MQLRGEQIQSIGGELYAYVFENRTRGIQRLLLWDIHLNCLPVRWQDADWETSISIEGLSWPIRRWTALDGMSLDRVTARDFFCAFYLSDHHKANLQALSLRRESGVNFRIRVSGNFALTGLDDLDSPDIRFDIEAEIPFSGLYVVPDCLFPKPTSPAEAGNVAGQFIDVNDFTMPAWDGRFRFELRPKEHEQQ